MREAFVNTVDYSIINITANAQVRYLARLQAVFDEINSVMRPADYLSPTRPTWDLLHRGAPAMRHKVSEGHLHTSASKSSPNMLTHLKPTTGAGPQEGSKGRQSIATCGHRDTCRGQGWGACGHRQEFYRGWFYKGCFICGALDHWIKDCPQN